MNYKKNKDTVKIAKMVLLKCREQSPTDKISEAILDSASVILLAILSAFAIAALVVATRTATNEKTNNNSQYYFGDKEEPFYNFRTSLFTFAAVNITFTILFFILIALDFALPRCSGKAPLFKYRNINFFFTTPLMVVVLAFNVYWGIKAVSAYQLAESAGEETTSAVEVNTALACGIYVLALPALLVVGKVAAGIASSKYMQK